MPLPGGSVHNCGVFLALVKHRVTDYDAAEEGDRLGCDERLITAYGILRDGREKTRWRSSR